MHSPVSMWETEAQEEVPAFLFYPLGMCLGMWRTPKKQERGASDGSLCANLYGCPAGAMGKPSLGLWCAHWSHDSANSYAYALFYASRPFRMFNFTYTSGPSVSVKFKICKGERKHRIIKDTPPQNNAKATPSRIIIDKNQTPKPNTHWHKRKLQILWKELNWTGGPCL